MTENIWQSVKLEAIYPSTSFHTTTLTPTDAGKYLRSNIELQGKGSATGVRLLFHFPEELETLFLTQPNIADIRETAAMGTFFSGIQETFPPGITGTGNWPQWIFTPPPLVFPLKGPHGWTGIALAAEPGKNLFNGWCWKGMGRGTAEIEICYNGEVTFSEMKFSILLLNGWHSTPCSVVKAYADALYELGWATRPQRTVSSWWKEPMICTWGEQWNITERREIRPDGFHSILPKLKSNPAHQQQRFPNRESAEKHVTYYETQANQTRWLKPVLDNKIPVGVVSTSDRWQLCRSRLLPDTDHYPDLRAFVDEHHAARRHVIAWWGLWFADGAETEWCLLNEENKPCAIDPESPEYRKYIREDIRRLLSPDGYDMDGFFLDLTCFMPHRAKRQNSSRVWGLELQRSYLSLIRGTAKEVKSDALIMTHCPHPYLADITDVLRLNDLWRDLPNAVDQAKYRHGIATAVSDWLINMDNWWMYDKQTWIQYLKFAPTLGIPSSWFTLGIRSAFDGDQPFTQEDYNLWRETWEKYRCSNNL